MQHAAQPDRVLKTRVSQSYVSIHAVPEPKIGGIILPLVNSHFYEAKKRCHDNQLQDVN